MKYLAVLGRLPEISLAELRALYTKAQVISPGLAVFSSNTEPEIGRLGGSLKLARELDASPLDFLRGLPQGKITFGVSDYSKGASAASARKEAMRLKKILVRHGRSVRVLDNKSPVLSTATVLHNGLGKKERAVELLLVNGAWYVGVEVQDIEAYRRRDQARPARDAKVGMLPPKLAQILINLCGPLPLGTRVLDPFCGTGVVLQEALLMGYEAYGTDRNERMVEYSKKNLEWLTMSSGHFLVSIGDATSFTWEQPIGAVACETYLGPPMSQPPAELKLKAVKQECREIILGFLKNIAPQLEPGTPLCLAVPAWRRTSGGDEKPKRGDIITATGERYSRLDLLDKIRDFGYNEVKYTSSEKALLYYREGQVVAREIIVLRKR